MRLRPFFEFELTFLGNRGMINATTIIGGPKCPCHYVARALGRVFLFQMQPSLWFTSLVSRGRLLQLPRVEAIITTASDR